MAQIGYFIFLLFFQSSAFNDEVIEYYSQRDRNDSLVLIKSKDSCRLLITSNFLNKKFPSKVGEFEVPAAKDCDDLFLENGDNSEFLVKSDNSEGYVLKVKSTELEASSSPHSKIVNALIALLKKELTPIHAQVVQLNGKKLHVHTYKNKKIVKTEELNWTKKCKTSAPRYCQLKQGRIYLPF